MKSIHIAVIAGFLAIAGFFGLAARCAWLGYWNFEDYAKQAGKPQNTIVTEPARRGSILDCRGRVLAASEKSYLIFAEPRAIDDAKAVANELAPLIDMPAHDICINITESRNSGFVKIRSSVSLDEPLIRRINMIRGIGIQTEWTRIYPTAELTSHVVGFTRSDHVGAEGLELQYDRQLSGTDGRLVFYADAMRRPIALKSLESHPVDGSDLITTIDVSIQGIVREELLTQINAFKAESGIGIVMDPYTGAILAMVCLPDYNPVQREKLNTDAMRNRCLTDPYEPGSIFKPMVAAWALDCGVINTTEQIFCENGNYHGKGFGTIGEYRRGFGNLTVGEILQESSNIGMAKIGQRMGAQKIYEGITVFGFGKPTGLDLQGEQAGTVRPLAKWSGYSVARVPFGHEVNVTAIQIARAFCILANSGRSIQPHLVKATIDKDGRTIKLKHSTATAGYIIKPEVAKWIVSKALVDVVNKGTGRNAKLERWQVFGKTGTANIANVGGSGYDEQNYVASFAGGAPAENPKIVVLVSIRKPDRSLGKGYTGGAISAPAAGKIIERTLNYLEKSSI